MQAFWPPDLELHTLKELEFFLDKVIHRCGLKSRGEIPSKLSPATILSHALAAILKCIEHKSTGHPEEIRMFLKRLRKIKFVCHQCGFTDKATIADTETIYDPATGDPEDPPYMACKKCLTGTLLPMRYTNTHGVTFISGLETKKNEKQSWHLDVKTAPA